MMSKVDCGGIRTQDVMGDQVPQSISPDKDYHLRGEISPSCFGKAMTVSFNKQQFNNSKSPIPQKRTPSNKRHVNDTILDNEPHPKCSIWPWVTGVHHDHPSHKPPTLLSSGAQKCPQHESKY